MKISINNNVIEIIKYKADTLCLSINGETVKIDILNIQKHSAKIELNKEEIEFWWTEINANTFQTVSCGTSFIYKTQYVLPKKTTDISLSKHMIYEVKAPVSGLISKIFVSEQTKVHKGQKLLSLNAMKMENEIQSPIDGTVKELKAVENKEVNKNDILLTIFYH